MNPRAVRPGGRLFVIATIVFDLIVSSISRGIKLKKAKLSLTNRPRALFRHKSTIIKSKSRESEGKLASELRQLQLYGNQALPDLRGTIVNAKSFLSKKLTVARLYTVIVQGIF